MSEQETATAGGRGAGARRRRRHAVGAPLALAAVLVLFASACSGTSLPSDTTRADSAGRLDVTLNGSGATFPKPFYEEAIATFGESGGGVRVTYAGGGSGQGQQELADKVVTWAGTDAPVHEEDLPGFKGGQILYFPTVAAPITVAYNVDGLSDLELSPTTIAGLFQAEITRWNAPEIAADNPGTPLPDVAVRIVHRADGSGTTANFSAFLAKAAPNWTLGTGKELSWPRDSVAEKGNDGVAAGVARDQGAIGYVDFSDADAAGLSTAAVRNAAGNYVAPTLPGAEAAVGAAPVAADLTYDPIDAPGADSYPITAPTWVIVYSAQADADVAVALRAWLGYLVGDAQSLAADLGYAPLPPSLAERARQQVNSVGSDG